LDGDGDLDLATANASSNDVSVLLNTGNGNFGAQQTYAAGSDPRGVTAADLDGDGDLDLAIANFDSDDVSVLLNTGNGTFAAPQTYAVGHRPRSVTAADLDADGDTDLATANVSSDDVSVLLNQCTVIPLITDQPTPAVVLPAGGGIAQFTVSASGEEPLTYQWRKDGVPLTDGPTISGATTPNLTVVATLADVGAYDVVVSSPDGQVVSDTAVIAVRDTCPSDTNADGTTDLQDLLAILGEFGSTCP
jgi:uncharacterized protein with beta-barrel porin domain